ncbi:MAG: dihydrolipoyl dehydrogenase [Christensenellaceae bacterium]|nr:dihydrolipoyl dehydrogenase [Christensenellaceae bacterium]MDD6926795.1 dihydrolipoyl dehydrogenase [bacterium]MDY2851620.1 dihydrolipoyl dehydrogenase [Christensenellaceae bacterium]
MDKYQVIVLGGGPGGYLAAERAGHAGLKTMVIEKEHFGGVCLNEGCVPSKTFLYSAKVLDYANHAKDFGVSVKVENGVDQAFVVERKNGVVKTLVSGVKASIKKAGVTMVEAEGKIVGKGEGGIIVEAKGTQYLAEKLIIATGSMPVVPPITGLRENLAAGYVMTNKEILDLKEIPGTLAVIGGGVIGLEMASYFSSVGSKVVVIEMMNKIAGPTDAEISGLLQKALEKKGVEFRLGAKVTAVEADGVVFEKDGKTEKVKADKVLCSIGRRAVTQGFGLENIGVNLERGAIVTDDKMMTNVANVYAVGDVNGKIMLAHTAYREAEVAVNNILGKKDHMRYNVIPSVVYTTPEIGSVGETEESAKAKGLSVKTLKLSLMYSGRYVAENTDLSGICKLIVNTKTNTLIGAHIIGSYASEYIVAVSALIDLEVDIEVIKKLVFPHPTVCEIIRETIWSE